MAYGGRPIELPCLSDFSTASLAADYLETLDPLPLEQALLMPFQALDATKILKKKIEPGKRNIWFQLQIVNPCPNRQEFLFWVKNNPDYLQMAIRKEGKILEVLPPIGKKHLHAKTALSKDAMMPLWLGEKERMDVFFQLDNWAVIPVDILLITTNAYIEEAQAEHILLGLFFGAILVNLLFNLLLFWRLRERHLALFAGYLISIATTILGTFGLGSVYIWSPNIQEFIIPLGAVFSGLLLLGFTHEILGVHLLYRSLSKLAYPGYLMGAAIVIFVFLSGNTNLLDFATLIFSLIIMGLILLSLIAASASGSKPARILAISWIAFVVGALFSVLSGLGITDAISITRDGAIIGIFMQLCLTSVAIAERVHSDQDIIAKLTKKKNAELERMIQDKTNAIQRILDSVQSGFFAIDRQFTVLAGFSKSCLRLIGKDFGAGKSYAHALGLDDRLKTHHELAIMQVYERTLPEKVSLAMVPSRVICNKKTLSLVPSVVMGKDQNYDSILFTVNDITDLVSFENQKRVDEAIILIFKQRTSFLRFIQDFKITMEQCRSVVAQTNQHTLRELLHTLKGNASLFGLTDLGAVIHKVESSKTPTVFQLQAIETTLEQFIEKYLTPFGITYQTDQVEYCQIPEFKVDQFLNQVSITFGTSDLLALCKNFCEETSKKIAIELLGPIENLVQNLAERLGKQVKFEIVGANLLLNPNSIDPILRNLNHLIRNSLDHGIESSGERRRNGKNRTAQLVLVIEKRRDGIAVSLEDDGRGIDTKEISLLAISKGILDAQTLGQMTENQIQMLVFKPDITTSEVLSEISGRGYGLAAVLSDITQAGGSIELASTANKGTRITLFMPQK